MTDRQCFGYSWKQRNFVGNTAFHAFGLNPKLVVEDFIPT
jgi:hypothetical protein